MTATIGFAGKDADNLGQTLNSVDDVENLLIPLTYNSAEFYRESPLAVADRATFEPFRTIESITNRGKFSVTAEQLRRTENLTGHISQAS